MISKCIQLKNFKFFILCLAVALINCERDDICAEGTATTPRLLVEFFDATSPEDLKNVPRLTLYGEGLIVDENGIETEPSAASSATLVFNANANSVELPLKIDDGDENELVTITRFVLEKDTNLRLNDTGISNKDIIEIRYQTEFIYVSRACGYKSIFKNLSVTRITDEDNWISSINVDVTEIENENTVHVRINH